MYWYETFEERWNDCQRGKHRFGSQWQTQEGFFSEENPDGNLSYESKCKKTLEAVDHCSEMITFPHIISRRSQ
uniref:Uncharacterized protein n=1 Tax=Setaria digitata TaxID=48799 RepID=A0A915PW05_9BILA